MTDGYEYARPDAAGLRALAAARGREDLPRGLAAGLEMAMPWHEREPSIFVG